MGALSYIFLFQCSTWLTELITASKYPEYKEYQERVARFMPRLNTSLPSDFSDQRVPGEAKKAERTDAKLSKETKGRRGRK